VTMDGIDGERSGWTIVDLVLDTDVGASDAEKVDIHDASFWGRRKVGILATGNR